MSFYQHPANVMAPSVTTILQTVASEALYRWKLNHAVDIINNNYAAYSQEEDVHAAVEKVSGVEADIGTWLHSLAEVRLNGWPDDPAIPDILIGHEETLERLTENFDAYLRYLIETYALDVIATEAVVHGTMYCDEYKSQPMYYSGTTDAILQLDNTIILLDFKTSKAVFDNYAAQVAGYAYAWNQAPAVLRNELPRVRRLQVVRINKMEKGEPYYIHEFSREQAKLAYWMFYHAISLWYLRSGLWGDVLANTLMDV